LALGFSEAINYSFLEEKELKAFDLASVEKISNPLSKENEILRTSLLPGLWKNLNLNLSQGQNNIKLFEIGTIFTEKGEVKSLSALAYGNVWDEWFGWEKITTTTPSFNFSFLKGVIEKILQNVSYKITSLDKNDKTLFLHPGKSAKIEINGKTTGIFGVINPIYTAELKNEVCYLELDIDTIEQLQSIKPVIFKSIKRTPQVKRDLSFIINNNTSYQKILHTIKQTVSDSDCLESVELFSIYDDESKIGKDNKSYSFHITFRHSSKTLTGDEINALMSKIVDNLKQKFNISLR
jgi:phenylalanyl-tRNA synthetase beta chain